MIKLTRIFENQFDDPAVSAEELRSFTEDHLGKIKGRAAMLATTEAAPATGRWTTRGR